MRIFRSINQPIKVFRRLVIISGQVCCFPKFDWFFLAFPEHASFDEVRLHNEFPRHTFLPTLHSLSISERDRQASVGAPAVDEQNFSFREGISPFEDIVWVTLVRFRDQVAAFPSYLINVVSRWPTLSLPVNPFRSNGRPVHAPHSVHFIERKVFHLSDEPHRQIRLSQNGLFQAVSQRRSNTEFRILGSNPLPVIRYSIRSPKPSETDVTGCDVDSDYSFPNIPLMTSL